MWRCLIWLVLFGTSHAAEPFRPVCSKYDYEVNLLERVLSNEMALKNTLDKISETHAKVKDTLKTIQGENVKLNDAMTALEVKKNDIDTKLASAIQAGITNVSGTVSEMKTTVQVLVTQTGKELKAMKEQSIVPLGMFSARLNSNEQPKLTANQNVVFKTVSINEGGGYDPSTGHFTASVAGVYMFTVQYCTAVNKGVHLEIVLEGERYRDHITGREILMSVSACRPLLRLPWETRSQCGLFMTVISTIPKVSCGAALLGY